VIGYEKFIELEAKVAWLEEYISDDDLDWCQSCGAYTETATHTDSGRVGGYDNWMPDEDIYCCDECGTKRGDQ